MTSQYDKLGSLLNEALKEEKIPQFNQKNTNSEQKSLIIDKKIFIITKNYLSLHVKNVCNRR